MSIALIILTATRRFLAITRNTERHGLFNRKPEPIAGLRKEGAANLANADADQQFILPRATR